MGFRFCYNRKTTDTKNLTLKFNNVLVGQIPIDALASKAPIYNRKWVKKELPKSNIEIKNLKKIKIEDALIKFYPHQIIQIKIGLPASMIKWLCVIRYKGLVQMRRL